MDVRRASSRANSCANVLATCRARASKFSTRNDTLKSHLHMLRQWSSIAQDI
jgi:hypothetical protein